MGIGIGELVVLLGGCFMFVLFGAVMGVGVWWFMKQRKGLASMDADMAAGADAKYRELFERTGYRHADLSDAPVEAQVLHSMAMSRMKAGAPQKIRMIRSLEGLTIHYEFDMQASGTGYRMSSRWWAEAPSRLGLHVAERELGSAGRKAASFMGSVDRPWSPIYPASVPLTNPALQARFQAYADNPGAASAVLTQDELKQALLALRHVDLRIQDGRISLEDPGLENTSKAFGGAHGMVGRPVTEIMDAQLYAHEAAGRLLFIALRASA